MCVIFFERDVPSFILNLSQYPMVVDIPCALVLMTWLGLHGAPLAFGRPKQGADSRFMLIPHIPCTIRLLEYGKYNINMPR